MAALAGTTDTYLMIGKREDVHDAIYDISPIDNPVTVMAKKLKADNTLHQWQTDALAAAAVNKQIEGDDATYASASPTTMLSNRTMISSKTVMVSRTADRISKYGRARETARLVTKKGKEIKKDIELAFCGMQGSSVGGAGTARQAAGLRAMITNFRAATGAANTAGTVPGYSSSDWALTAADGTVSTFIEADLKAALELAWTDGGDPSVVITNSKQKARMSAFAGASAFDGFHVNGGRAQQGAVIAGIDLYVSDFGSHKVVLSRGMGQTGVLCLDPEYIGIAWFDKLKVEDLAKTGDATKKQLVCEYTFVAQNPDAHAQVIGCTSA
jgi:hypothetical protein